jgi:hypothetical protein
LAPERLDVPRFSSIYLAQPHEISVEVLVGAAEMFHDYPQGLDGSAPVLSAVIHLSGRRPYLGFDLNPSKNRSSIRYAV